METNEWFGDWFNSKYYHILYSNRTPEEATSFIQKLLAFLNPLPDAKILDVACGKGRHSIALNELGFDVTGIDLSSASINEALKNENDHLHFYVHDMRKPFFTNYFDFAFNFFTSFGYFKTKREHINAISSITKSLQRNGIFVIDYLNVKTEEKADAQSFEKKIDDITFLISKWQSPTHFFKQIQYFNKQGILKDLATERVSKFTLDDFDEMLKTQGFTIQKVFGDYDLSPYQTNISKRLIIIAKKA